METLEIHTFATFNGFYPCEKVTFLVTFALQVVNVWKFGKGKDKNRLTLKQALFGHTEAVTCLTVSSAYNVIVSGSRDRTCIIWDLTQLVFVRQLRGHAAPVAAVYINELTVLVLSFIDSFQIFP